MLLYMVILIIICGNGPLRPDQTSRGDPVEEPRMRLSLERFELLSLRFGPFNEFLDAEREHGQAAPLDSSPRVWMHPTFNTVASALVLSRLTHG